VTEDFDPSLVFGALPPDARAALRRFTARLGVPEDGWREIPALRRYAETAAVLELADLEGATNVGDEVAAACRALGLEDDGTRATRPSDSIYRRIRRWRSRGRAVQPPQEGAA